MVRGFHGVWVYSWVDNRVVNFREGGAMNTKCFRVVITGKFQKTVYVDCEPEDVEPEALEAALDDLNGDDVLNNEILSIEEIESEQEEDWRLDR